MQIVSAYLLKQVGDVTSPVDDFIGRMRTARQHNDPMEFVDGLYVFATEDPFCAASSNGGAYQTWFWQMYNTKETTNTEVRYGVSIVRKPWCCMYWEDVGSIAPGIKYLRTLDTSTEQYALRLISEQKDKNGNVLGYGWNSYSIASWNYQNSVNYACPYNGTIPQFKEYNQALSYFTAASTYWSEGHGTDAELDAVKQILEEYGSFHWY